MEEDRSVSPRWLASLGNEDLEKLGPESGTWCASWIGESGHGKRLCLLREPEWRSPAVACRGPVAVVFDGQLNNGAALSSRFGSRSSSNPALLIAEGYDRLGEEIVSLLNGTFAVLIWDSEAGLLLAGRDRIGFHPLFFVEHRDGVLLSTFIDTLVDDPRVSSDVNRVGIAQRLSHRSMEADETYYRSVRRVPPGHLLRVRDADFRLIGYWDPIPADGEMRWVTEDEAHLFDELLVQAVDRCLDFGDAAIYLSGGLDSVSLAAVAADRSTERGQATPLGLSMLFPPPASEEIIQRGVIDGLGLRHVVVPFEAITGERGILQSVTELNAEWPWPVFNQWSPAYQNLGRIAKEKGCRVVLTGEGGDEWLSVSPSLSADLIRRADLPGLLGLMRATYRSFDYTSPMAFLRQWLWRFGLRPLAGRTLRAVMRRLAPTVLSDRWRANLLAERPEWLVPDDELRATMDERLERRVEEHWRTNGHRSLYLAVLRDTFGSVLRSVEFEESYHEGRRLGLQVRHPFWDADLVDFLIRTPPRLLCLGGRMKGLVRESVARRFPDLGFERQKKLLMHGFFLDILMTEGPVVWQDLGGARSLVDLGLVDRSRLETAMKRLFAREDNRVGQILNILNFESWLRSRV